MNDATPISTLLHAGKHVELVTLVYDELRVLARSRVAQDRASHALQPTALVHEAWERIFRNGHSVRFESRAHFFGAAAEAMRRILVDRARRNSCLKRGGALQREGLERYDVIEIPQDEDVTGISEALEVLVAQDPRAALIVKLRYFVGLSIEEVASILKVSPTTVKSDWTATKAWLRLRLRHSSDGEPGK